MPEHGEPNDMQPLLCPSWSLISNAPERSHCGVKIECQLDFLPILPQCKPEEHNAGLLSTSTHPGSGQTP